MTSQLSTLLGHLHDTPPEDLLWLAVADCLEEDGQRERAELLRHSRRIRGMDQADGSRLAAESRIRGLIAAGVRPCVPEITNSIGMRSVLIPPGTFWMGSEDGEDWRRSDERPRHEVEITRPFWLGVTPVTQAQYRRVTRRSPSYFAATGQGAHRVTGVVTDDFPVECVSWEDAVEFCRRLSARAAEARAGRVYRLPTEAEWEYACRAGLASHDFHFGPTLDGSLANFWPSGPARTCPVASYPPNAWGLYDMHGQVWEWCHDWNDHTGYGPAGRRRDPQGAEAGVFHVMRGGCWSSEAEACRSAQRGAGALGRRDTNGGFRVCFTMA